MPATSAASAARRPAVHLFHVDLGARNEEAPMPTSRNTEIGSVSDELPRTFGPIMTPRMSSQTTSGTLVRERRQ